MTYSPYGMKKTCISRLYVFVRGASLFSDLEALPTIKANQDTPKTALALSAILPM
jgi:hypothetical protein